MLVAYTTGSFWAKLTDLVLCQLIFLQVALSRAIIWLRIILRNKVRPLAFRERDLFGFCYISNVCVG